MNSNNVSRIESFFLKRLSSQNKLLKIKLNSINNYPNHIMQNFKNKTINTKVNEIPFIIKNNTIINPKEENSKNCYNKNKKLIFSYMHKSKNKYSYNNIELKNDLKRYTNNSLAFKCFNYFNKNYHPYSANKVIKSILFHTKTEGQKEDSKNIFELNNIPQLIYTNNQKNQKNYKQKTISRNIFFTKKIRTFKKKFSKFYKFSPIKIPKFDENKRSKDPELRDEVDINIFENSKLKRAVKKSLLNDINHDEVNYKLYKDYLKAFTNKVNFIEDIYMVPHIQNHLSLRKPIDNLVLLNEKLRDKNFLHKQVALSMNKILIIKILLKKKREMELKMMEIKENEEIKPKKKWKNDEESFEKKLNQFENQFEHFDLTDYFGKCNNYTIIGFANKKLKDCLYSKKF